MTRSAESTEATKRHRLRQSALVDGAIPLTWWTVEPNFGDLLSPFLVERLTGAKVRHVHLRAVGARHRVQKALGIAQHPSFLAIGSILSRANAHSTVWGSGAFGTEGRDQVAPRARYTAVRGPLSRNLVRMYGGECPEIYGDPGLLLPQVHATPIERTHRVGVVLRWAERTWAESAFAPDVKKIFLHTDDVVGTLDALRSCDAIFSSSLHGLILADAYGLSSAWLASGTPKGLEFKFYDYFLSVNKVQKPQRFTFDGTITADRLLREVRFDDRPIEFSPETLLDACPFLERA